MIDPEMAEVDATVMARAVFEAVFAAAYGDGDIHRAVGLAHVNLRVVEGTIGQKPKRKRG